MERLISRAKLHRFGVFRGNSSSSCSTSDGTGSSWSVLGKAVLSWWFMALPFLSTPTINLSEEIGKLVSSVSDESAGLLLLVSGVLRLINRLSCHLSRSKRISKVTAYSVAWPQLAAWLFVLGTTAPALCAYWLAVLPSVGSLDRSILFDRLQKASLHFCASLRTL